MKRKIPVLHNDVVHWVFVKGWTGDFMFTCPTLGLRVDSPYMDRGLAQMRQLIAEAVSKSNIEGGDA